MIKVIIFDFDGVIVESVRLKADAFAELFENEGSSIRDEVVNYHLKNAGVSRYEKFRHIYEHILKRPLTEGRFRELCGKFSELVMEGVIRAPYVNGAIEFLKRHAADYRFFVTSATPQKEIEEIIVKRGISGLFEAVYGAPRKKADAVREIMEKTASLPREVVYVGDAMSDYEAAKGNFIFFIGREPLAASAVFQGIDCPKIKNLAELPEAIRGHDNIRIA